MTHTFTIAGGSPLCFVAHFWQLYFLHKQATLENFALSDNSGIELRTIW